MRTIIASIALFGIAFAGCVTGESKEGPSSSDPLSPDEAIDPNSEFGQVQGTVVSEETTPIEGASVGLAETEFVTSTNDQGIFVLRNVPPGKYVLAAGALGYGSSARNVEVTQGVATKVTFTLTSIEVLNETIAEVVHFNGFFECALASDVWISSCSYPYTAVHGTAKNNGVNLSQYNVPPDIQKNTHRFNFTVKKGIGQFVSELTWQSSSAAATRMLDMTLCGDYDYVWDECVDRIRYGPGNGVSGTNPVKSTIDGKEFIDKGKGKGEYDLTKRDSIWVMTYIGLPFGDPQVAFQQKFEVWNTMFYNGVGPEDYSILPDS